MKIDVKQKGSIYILDINGEIILKDKKLSVVVNKIEDYLKMRFLKEKPKKGFSKVMENFLE